VLSNRYLLNERIAAGGMGEVWRGTDQLLQRDIAVKVLLPSLMSDSEFVARFRTEARMMAALRHPGIVQVYDCGEDAVVGGSKLDYLVMEFVDGVPLSKKIQAAGRLGVAESLGILAQAAEALQVAHEAGIVHRDVKPSNLLVRPGGAVVLVDFGVARSSGITGITSTNVVLGSAHYMAPEQAEGKPVSPATDVYALGAVAFSCLAGRPPYVGDNPMQVLAQLVHGQPPLLPPDVPPAVVAVVLRALDREPGRRFPSAAALAAAARSPQQGGGPVGGFGQQPGHPTPSGGYPASPSGMFPPSGTFSPSGSFAEGRAAASGGNPAYPAPAAYSTPPSGMSPAASAGFAPGRAEHPGNPYHGGPTGPTGPVPPVSAAPASASGGNGRRNATFAAIAAAVLIGVIGLVAAISLRPDASAAETQPPRGGGVDGPALGGPRDLPGRTGNGRQNQPLVPQPSQTATGAPATHGRTSASAASTPTTDPTSPQATSSATPSTTPTTGTTTNPYSAKQVCGAAFVVIDSAALKSAGVTVGKVVLMFNAATGKNCTVTLKNTEVGTASAASAYLEVQGGTRSTDSGNFQYYAGPVKAAAQGVCVKWGGSVDGVAYDSPFEHCN
jgi:serine/threonine-protein kinase